MNEIDDKWVRRFTTDATAKHKNGFTIYKITSYIFPRASPEAVTALSIWKRFSELQRLQRRLRLLHRHLHLPGTCPSFTKWGYFRRLEPRVVQDRQAGAQQLLEFIAQHPPLFTSTDFVTFFQSSYPEPSASEQICGNILAIRSSLLLPAETSSPLEYPSSDEDSFSTTESHSRVSTLDAWSMEDSAMSRTLAKSGHESSRNIESSAEIMLLPTPVTATRVTLAHTKKLNLPDLIAFNDNNKSVMDLSTTSMGSSDDSLGYLDSASAIFENGSDDKHNKFSEFIVNSNINDELEIITEGTNQSISQSETDLAASLSQSVSSFFIASKEYLPIVEKTIRPGSGGEVTKTLGGKLSINNNNCPETAERGDSYPQVRGSSLQESYVFEAGYLLSLGARSEADGNYRKAFDCYKAGIEKMLIGVQGDTDDFRRQIVKDKTTKYLSHAENIYINHLNDPETEMPTSENFGLAPLASDLSARRLDYSRLSDYRVLGVLDAQVMLVLCSQTQTCYTIKVIQKIANRVSDEDYFTKPSSDGRLPVLPLDVPYMVKLEAYIETPNMLFLVLQYVAGGKLLEYIESHARTVFSSPLRRPNLHNVLMDPGLHEPPRNLGSELSITDIIINSQRLLLDVDDALAGRPAQGREERSLHSLDKLNHTIGDDGVTFYVQSSRRTLPAPQLRRWAAELVTALHHLQRCGLLLRSLRGDDLLLGAHGQLTLTYRTGEICSTQGTAELLAPHLPPELALPLAPPHRASTSWCLGAVLYELLTGLSLGTVHPSGFNSHTILLLPDDLQSDAQSLLSQLLCYDPEERIGNGPSGLEEVMCHEYFRSVDWVEVREDFFRDHE